MTKKLQCKNCVNFSPLYPPREGVFPYDEMNPYIFSYNGKCHCLGREWFYTCAEDYCNYPDFIGEERNIENEELIYKFLRHEAERSGGK